MVLRAAASHTTDLTVEFVNDGGYCGAFIYWDATVDAAPAAVTVILQMVEMGGGATENLNSFSDTIASVEEKIVQIGRQMAAADNIDEIHARQLPYRFNIVFDHADTDAITYSASIPFREALQLVAVCACCFGC